MFYKKNQFNLYPNYYFGSSSTTFRVFDDMISDIFESKDTKIKFDDVIKLELPGVGRDNIEMTENDSTIFVSVKQDDTKKEYVIDKVGKGDTTAEYKDGILYIYNTKIADQTKKIEIK